MHVGCRVLSYFWNCPSFYYSASLYYQEYYALFTAQLAGEARQLGCPKIALDHVRVYIYIYIYIYICLCALGFLTIGCIRCY